MRRLGVRLRPGPAMTVTRVTLGHRKMVYVIVASRVVKYREGRSPIVYIGTTKNGAADVHVEPEPLRIGHVGTNNPRMARACRPTIPAQKNSGGRGVVVPSPPLIS